MNVDTQKVVSTDQFKLELESFFSPDRSKAPQRNWDSDEPEPVPDLRPYAKVVVEIFSIPKVRDLLKHTHREIFLGEYYDHPFSAAMCGQPKADHILKVTEKGLVLEGYRKETQIAEFPATLRSWEKLMSTGFFWQFTDEQLASHIIKNLRRLMGTQTE